MKRYPKYKDSGVAFLGDIPEHWTVVPAKAVCNVRPSNVDKKSLAGETKVRLCNYTDVYYNDVITGDMDLMEATASEEQIARFTLRRGDVIITKDSETADDIGVGAYVPQDFPGVVCGYHLALIRPHDGLRGDFLKRVFDSTYAQSAFETRANGLTRVALGVSDISTLPLALPPVDEQQAIAAFLDRETAMIDGLVAEQRRLIELLKEKRHAVISHAVTKGLNPNAKLKPSGIDWLGDVPEHWEVKKLHYLLKEPPKNGLSPEISQDGTVPTFSIAAVRNGLVNIADHLKLVSLTEDQAAPYRVRRNDVLVLRGSGSKDFVGTAGIVEVEPPNGCIYPDILIRIRPNDSITPRFLVRCLNSATMRPQLELAAQTAAGIWKVSGGALDATMMAVPPIQEQTEIETGIRKRCYKLDSLTAEAEKAIALLLERRTALISAAVTGKIDVSVVGTSTVTAKANKPYSSGFARQLLAAEILHRHHGHPTTGRVKLQKLIHLCEHIAEIEEIHGSYGRKAAGPFDPKIMFGVAAGLKRLRWFVEVKDAGRTYYRSLENAGSHQKYLAPWGAKLPKINHVLRLLGNAETEQCEIVSTLYAAWNDLLIEGQSPSDDEIIREASSPARWHESKTRIAAGKWPIALKWMREKELVPRGFGSHTKRDGSPE